MASPAQHVEDRNERIEMAARRRGVGEDPGHHETSSSGVSSSSIASSVDVRIQSRVTTQELPGVDVADGDELGEPRRSRVRPRSRDERRREHLLAPRPMPRAALGGEARDRRGAVLLGEQADGVVAHPLVVGNDLPDCLVGSGHRARIALVLDARHLALDGCLEDAVATAEVADDGLDGHAGAACDRVERQVSSGLLPEDPGRRIQDRGSRPICGLSPPNHPVRSRAAIHVSKTNTNVSQWDRRESLFQPM